jgi:hypothetical protein
MSSDRHSCSFIDENQILCLMCFQSSGRNAVYFVV